MQPCRPVSNRRYRAAGIQALGGRERTMKKYIISIAFLVGALITLSVLLYPFVADYVNSRSQTRVVTKYFDDVTAIDDGSKQAILSAAHEYNEKLPSNRSRFQPKKEETAEYFKQLDTGRGVMGILAIDKINVNLPIYHGTDEEIGRASCRERV